MAGSHQEWSTLSIEPEAYRIIEAPLCVESNWSGIDMAPQAMLRAGLAKTPAGRDTVSLPPADWRPERSTDGVLNPLQVREYTLNLADTVHEAMRSGRVPIVLGGDCTILLGCLLGMRRTRSARLFFLDGHMDFYAPEQSPTGETADMELGLAVGRGPEVLTEYGLGGPLVSENDTAVFGFRDEAIVEAIGGPNVRDSAMHCASLSDIRLGGFSNAVCGALAFLGESDPFWLHVDLDVLNPWEMPAVDYPMADGLRWGELYGVIRRCAATERLAGLDVTIFNPTFDWDGSVAQTIARVLTAALGLR